MAVGTPKLSIFAINSARKEGATGTDILFRFKITRGSGNLEVQSTVTWTVAHINTDNTDFTINGLPTGSVTFLPNERTKYISISIKGDDTYEANERFKVTLSNPNNATLKTLVAYGTI